MSSEYRQPPARIAAADVSILLLELQPPIVASSRTLPEADLRKAAGVVARLAASLEMPLFASAVPLGQEAPELIAELEAVTPHVRSVISPFADPAIKQALRDAGRRTLAIGGVSSEIALLQAVLDARREGYDAHVLVDLCGGLGPRTEATAFEQMRAAGATMSNISSFFTGLVSDMTSPDGQAVMGAMATLWSWGQAG